MSEEHPTKVLLDYMDERASALEKYVSHLLDIEVTFARRLEESGYIGALSREDLVEIGDLVRSHPDATVEKIVDAWIGEFDAAIEGQVDADE